jgi:hypothetical protein
MCDDYGIEKLGSVSFNPVLLDHIERGINIFSEDISEENKKLVENVLN